MRNITIERTPEIPRERLLYHAFGPWERIVLEEDERHRGRRCDHAVIMLVMRGRVTLFIGETVRQILEGGEIILVPAQVVYHVQAQELSRLVTCQCDDHLKRHTLVENACQKATSLPKPISTKFKILFSDIELVKHIALVEIYLRIGMGSGKPVEHQQKIYQGLQHKMLDYLMLITNVTDLAIFFHPVATTSAN